MQLWVSVALGLKLNAHFFGELNLADLSRLISTGL